MPTEIEREVPRLLKRYLDPIEPEQDIAAGVRRKLRDGQRVAAPRQAPRLAMLSSASLVAVLLIAVLAVNVAPHPASSMYNPHVGATPFPVTILTPGTMIPGEILSQTIPVHPIAHSAPVGNTTLYLEDWYLDPTRSALHYALVGDGALGNEQTTITDSAGNVINDEGGGSASDLPNGTDNFIELPPLPLPDFGTHQNLTLTVSSPDGKVTWKLTMPITLPAPHLAKPLPPPQTHDSLTLRVTGIAWSHAGTQFDGDPGGARIFIHISGLPPGKANYLFEFATIFPTKGGSEGNAGPSIFKLHGPWLVDLLPNITEPHFFAHVSSTGETDIQVMFLVPHMPAQGVTTLTLDQLAIRYASGGASSTEQLFVGPWSFQIPLA